jgi:hypothetical protein
MIVFGIIMMSLFALLPHSQYASNHVDSDTVSPCPEQSLTNDSFWVHMNPIHNATVGDHLNISGITNLPPGEKLQVSIHPAALNDQNNKNISQYPATQIIEISQNQDNDKKWSVEIDSLNLKPNYTHPYMVSVCAVDYSSVRDEKSVFLVENLSIIPGATYTYMGITPYQNISSVEIWIMGTSFTEVSKVPITQNGLFTFSLDRETTKKMNTDSKKSQMYSLILHYPSPDDQYDLTYNRAMEDLVDSSGKVYLEIAQHRETGTSDVSKQVMDTFTKYGGNDTYRQIDLVVTPPWISLDPIRESTNSRNFTITGMTNIPPGEEILVEVYDSKYSDRGSWYQNGQIPGEFSQVGTIQVEKGPQENNLWTLPVQSIGWKPGRYVIYAEAVYENARLEDTFNVTDTKEG